MTRSVRTITPQTARRLAITRQQLAGEPPPAPSSSTLLEVTRALGCLQLDPISAVARSHQLVLFSRAGAYDLRDLDALLWEDRHLFEYWAHAASIVLTEDYPIHQVLMRDYGTDRSVWGRRALEWADANHLLRDAILRELEVRGPLQSRQLSEDGIDPEAWVSTGWTSGRNVSRMLDFLWLTGKIMVVGRVGGQKVWGLAKQHLPAWTPTDPLTEGEVVEQAAQKALRALGTARPQHIKVHYTRFRYPGLDGTLKALESDGRIMRVQIKDSERSFPGVWYVHADDLPLLDQIEADDWPGRTTLLSPFDNLICDRGRTELLFDFNYRIEIYVPRHKRQYGYYVLPILHGDRLIGRIDPQFERKHKRLQVYNVYAEPDAPADAGPAVRSAIERLAGFLGAREIVLGDNVPSIWQAALRAL